MQTRWLQCWRARVTPTSYGTFVETSLSCSTTSNVCDTWSSISQPAGTGPRECSSFGVRGRSLRQIVIPSLPQLVLEPTEPREPLLGFSYLGLELVCFRFVASRVRGSSTVLRNPHGSHNCLA